MDYPPPVNRSNNNQLIENRHSRGLPIHSGLFHRPTLELNAKTKGNTPDKRSSMQLSVNSSIQSSYNSNIRKSVTQESDNEILSKPDYNKPLRNSSFKLNRRQSNSINPLYMKKTFNSISEIEESFEENPKLENVKKTDDDNDNVDVLSPISNDCDPSNITPFKIADYTKPNNIMNTNRLRHLGKHGSHIFNKQFDENYFKEEILNSLRHFEIDKLSHSSKRQIS